MNKLEAILYKVLFAVGLGWPYNLLKCRLNVYPKFSHGACMYCGVQHGLNWSVARRVREDVETRAAEMGLR